MKVEVSIEDKKVVKFVSILIMRVLPLNYSVFPRYQFGISASKDFIFFDALFVLAYLNPCRVVFLDIIFSLTNF